MNFDLPKIEIPNFEQAVSKYIPLEASYFCQYKQMA